MHPLVATILVALGPATTLGMARFAYGLALPAMKADLALSYAQAGWLNTANAVGYLIGALPAARVIGRFGARATLLGGMLATAVAILASGLTRSFELISILRLAAGIAGAMTFVAGGTMASQIASAASARQALIFGVYLGGVGLGILMSGLFVPALLTWASAPDGLQAWQLAWLAIGTLSIALTVLAALAAPREFGSTTAATQRSGSWPVARFAPALIAYLLYGVGYIGYLTFIVAYLERQGFGVAAVSAFWTLLGAASIACSWIWSRPVDRLRGGRALACILGVLLAGNALPLVSAHPAVSIVSAVLFGGSFTAVPASLIAILRRGLAPAHMPSAIGLMTGAFAAGQIAGPVVGGALADWFGGLAWSLVFSVATLALAIAVALAQKHTIAAAHR